MKQDGVLIVDANALGKRQVGLINQLALAFHSAGAFVVFAECVKPNPTIESKGRLRRYGYGFDEIVQLEEEHHEAHDLAIVKFIQNTLESQGDNIVVITGSGIVFQKISEKGGAVLLHG